MIDAKLLNLLCCPESHQPLQLADEYLLQKLNQLITAGSLKNRAGQPLARTLDGALIRTDRTIIYPIVNRLPVLLVEEGILLPAELNWPRP